MSTHPDTVKAFAPTGALRASINTGNPILASGARFRKSLHDVREVMGGGDATKAPDPGRGGAFVNEMCDGRRRPGTQLLESDFGSAAASFWPSAKPDLNSC